MGAREAGDLSGRRSISNISKLYLRAFLRPVRRPQRDEGGEDGHASVSSVCREPLGSWAPYLLSDAADEGGDSLLYQPDRIGEIIFHLPGNVEAGEDIV